MTAAKELVLITGVSGFLGAAVALEFLSQGYRVRGTVRSEAKAAAFLEKYKLYAALLELVIVPDIAVSGAFNEVMGGVTRVVHTASPFFFAIKKPSELLDPAIQGTIGALEAASKTSSVTSVVITSSVAAVFERTKGLRPGYCYTSEDWNKCTMEEALAETNPVLVYVASKVLAEKAAWNYMEDHKPKFHLTTLCPTLILGPALQPLSSLADLNQSAKSIWGLVDAEVIPKSFVATSVDVRDCAKAHFEAALRPIAGGKRYLLIGGAYSNAAAAKLLRSCFPDQASRIPTTGDPPFEHYTWDVSPAEIDLGLKWTSLETCVRDAGEQLFSAEQEP